MQLQDHVVLRPGCPASRNSASKKGSKTSCQKADNALKALAFALFIAKQWVKNSIYYLYFRVPEGNTYILTSTCKCPYLLTGTSEVPYISASFWVKYHIY